MSERPMMPRDGLEGYYHRKLWEMLPGIYKQRDGDDATLDRMLRLIAGQAAQLRRSQDRMWENQSVSTADSWALPYLADLVATRMISEFNPRGRRADVAKTIYYRRRAGTSTVIEELIRDIAGWQGRVVEKMRRLVRMPHRLDGPLVDPPTTHLTKTPPGGIADLRAVESMGRTGGPFEEFHRLPDVRSHSGHNGRFNLPNVGCHLYRLEVFEVDGVTPSVLDDDGDSRLYTFDPSGRSIPLYSSGKLDEDADGAPHSMPDALSCEQLNQVVYRVDDEVIRRLWDHLADETIDEPAQLYETLAKFARKGLVFDDRQRFFRLLLAYTDGLSEGDSDSERVLDALDDIAMDPGCGRAFFESGRCLQMLGDEGKLSLRDAGPASLEDPDLVELNASTEALVDPELGRVTVGEDTPLEAVTYCYATPGRVGAGPWYRPAAQMRSPDSVVVGGGPVDESKFGAEGVVQFDDNRSYQLVSEISVDGELVIQAADGRRPYVEIEESFRVIGSDAADCRLVVDGLWFGAADDEPARIVVDGEYEQVVVRNCTLDPGADASADDTLDDDIAAVALEVVGDVGELVVESSIVEGLHIDAEATVGAVRIEDAALVAANGEPALAVESSSDVELEGVTVLGEVQLPRIDASSCIFTGDMEIGNYQQGCVRYSAAPEDADLPRPYRVFRLSERHFPLFVSSRFGDPYFLRLRDHAPAPLRSEAEHQMEMGVYHSAFQPARRDDLQTKIDEYLPFGQHPLFIDQT